jgi:hypothetical protein
MHGSDAAVEIYTGSGGDFGASEEVRGLMTRNKISGNGKAARRLALCLAGLMIAAMMLKPAVAMPQAASTPPKTPTVTTQAPSQQVANADDPASALTGILTVACQQDTAKFPDYLTAKNAAFFKQLTTTQQVALLRRLVLLDDPGRALLSARGDGTSELRCETRSVTRLIHIGVPRTDQNISFVPIDVKPDRQIDFGLLSTKEGWKLLSIGVLMLDFAQLQPEWDAQDMADREEVAIEALHKICTAIDTYQKAFEKLPETLAQLGPEPKEGISPEAAGLLSAELVAGTVEGYTLRYRVVPAGTGNVDTRFELAATPTEYGKGGKRSFYISENGKLRGADKMGAPATAADPLIDETAGKQAPQ